MQTEYPRIIPLSFPTSITIRLFNISTHYLLYLVLEFFDSFFSNNTIFAIHLFEKALELAQSQYHTFTNIYQEGHQGVVGYK